MSLNRRFVLKGMALTGLASTALGTSVSALAGIEPAPAAAAGPTLALVKRDGLDSAFVQGARSALGHRLQVRPADGELDAMLEVDRQLRSGQPLHIIGLLDDAAATLVIDLARSAGARVHWLGQHTATGGQSRHRLLNTTVAEGCSRQLSRQLHACGAGFTLTEERQGSASAPRQLGGPTRSAEHTDQWAASVGYLLGSLGTRRPAVAPLVATTGRPLSGSFVSFLIET